jgi:hypothetical protein
MFPRGEAALHLTYFHDAVIPVTAAPSPPNWHSNGATDVAA